MKTGANSSDQNLIKKLEKEGHSAETISAITSIDNDAVKAFMVDPEAESSIGQAIDADSAAIIGELQASIVDQAAEIIALRAKISDLIETEGEDEDEDEGFGE